MTRNTPPAFLTSALLTAAVAIGLGLAAQTTGASAAQSPGTGSATGEPVPACRTDDLTATVIGQPRTARSTTRDAVLRLTNSSGRTCHVQGWADVAMVTAPGDIVPVPTRRIDQAGGDIVLAPAAAVSARLQWDTCDAEDDSCGVGVALQYIVDPESTGTLAELTAVPEADRAGITMTALRIGPLQSGRSATG
jgi:hypothetical protein